MIKLLAWIFIASFVSGFIIARIGYHNGYTDGARVGFNTVIKTCATPGKHS